MAYLTFEEYGDMLLSEVTDEEFARLLPRASDFIDIQTQYFYKQHDLESDFELRRLAFKKSIGYQIEFMSTTGATTSYDINSPNSWSVGRTNVTESSASNGEAPNILSHEAISALSSVGLLYRGIRS